MKPQQPITQFETSLTRDSVTISVSGGLSAKIFRRSDNTYIVTGAFHNLREARHHINSRYLETFDRQLKNLLPIDKIKIKKLPGLTSRYGINFKEGCSLTSKLFQGAPFNCVNLKTYSPDCRGSVGDVASLIAIPNTLGIDVSSIAPKGTTGCNFTLAISCFDGLDFSDNISKQDHHINIKPQFNAIPNVKSSFQGEVHLHTAHEIIPYSKETIFGKPTQEIAHLDTLIHTLDIAKGATVSPAGRNVDRHIKNNQAFFITTKYKNDEYAKLPAEVTLQIILNAPTRDKILNIFSASSTIADLYYNLKNTSDIELKKLDVYDAILKAVSPKSYTIDVMDITLEGHWNHGLSPNSPLVHGSLFDIGNVKIGDTVTIQGETRTVVNIAIVKATGLPLITYSGDIIKPVVTPIKIMDVNVEGHWVHGISPNAAMVHGSLKDNQIKPGMIISIMGQERIVSDIAIVKETGFPLITYKGSKIAPITIYDTVTVEGHWVRGMSPTTNMILASPQDVGKVKAGDTIFIKGEARTVVSVVGELPHITYAGPHIKP